LRTAYPRRRASVARLHRSGPKRESHIAITTCTARPNIVQGPSDAPNDNTDIPSAAATPHRSATCVNGHYRRRSSAARAFDVGLLRRVRRHGSEDLGVS
jgi:hypothetical protein